MMDSENIALQKAKEYLYRKSDQEGYLNEKVKGKTLK
jgi:hypothetical protein